MMITPEACACRAMRGASSPPSECPSTNTRSAAISGRERNAAIAATASSTTSPCTVSAAPCRSSDCGFANERLS